MNRDADCLLGDDSGVVAAVLGGMSGLDRLLPFNNAVFPSAPAAAIGSSRDKMLRNVGSLIANGGTALYDAIRTQELRNLRFSGHRRETLVLPRYGLNGP